MTSADIYATAASSAKNKVEGLDTIYKHTSEATSTGVWTSSSTTSGDGGYGAGFSSTARLSLLQDSNPDSIMKAVPQKRGKLAAPDKAGVESTRQLVKKT